MATLDKVDLAKSEASGGASEPSIRRPGTSAIVAVALIVGVVFASYFDTLTHLASRWTHDEEYSHGFLVPLVSCWLLWQRRNLAAAIREPVSGRWLGAAFLLASALIRLSAIFWHLPLVEPLALITCLCGATALIGGYAAVRWAWPAFVFLLFMIPLPGFLADRLSGPLQHVATVSSTYVLQTLGVPAVAAGNVIWLSQGSIGVVEACSGLRMLMTFAAVTTAAVFVFNLAGWEKICLLLSSVGIAIAANVCRISITGLAHELAGPEIAHKIFHDFAGWIMIPLAMVMLGAEMFLISKLFPRASSPAPGPRGLSTHLKHGNEKCQSPTRKAPRRSN